jgi:hypothetical protein
MCCSLVEVGGGGTAFGLAVGLQILRGSCELLKGGFEVGGDVGGDDLGCGEVAVVYGGLLAR